MKTLVLHYSHTGNNAWLARKIVTTLDSDNEPITPRLNLLPLLILFSLLKIRPGVKRLRHRVDAYDAVIVVGPIWMGQLILPLYSVIKKYGKRMRQLYFATCCGSEDEKKDDKFGYGSVFEQVKNLAEATCVHCEAFPIGLVLPPEQREDSKAMMAARLSDENFTGVLQQRFFEFIGRITSAAENEK
jgi:hypothetical protein